MGKRGFTLIELLVVISIIALLSSVVMASLNAARDKARVAAASQFSANVQHAAGDEALGMWDFDECSGSSAVDRSGFGNNGSLVGGAAYSSGDTPTGRGCSMNLSGGGMYLNAGTGASLSTVTGPVTVMGWMKITTSHCYNLIFSNDNDVASSNGFSLGTYCGNQTLFRIRNGAAASLAGPNLASNTWYHLAGVYDGSTMSLYIDGKLAASRGYSGGIGSPASNTNIVGALGNCPTCSPHGLLIDGVAVFAKALVASEVERAYALGLSGKGVAAGI